MCTVTVLHTGDRVLVTMNRDERRSRGNELPPAEAGGGHVPRWVGPADGARGGTWFGASDHGVIACLLNAYEPGDLALLGRDDVPSRGGIIPRLLALERQAGRRWLRSELDPSPYPSFTLVVVTADAGELVIWRSGRELGLEPIDEGWTMVTSSFFNADEVVPWRHRQFQRWRDSGEEEVDGVPAFNLLEVDGRREWSPLMTRPFSITHSLTQAELRPSESSVRLRYWRRDGESAIDTERPTAAVHLPLSAAAVAS
jgi:uncharacterized protein with NRDE domain